MMVNSRDYMFVLDFKSDYFHIKIATRSQSYLGYKWNGKYYKYTTLTFRVNMAPGCFIKVVSKCSSIGEDAALEWLDT
jgi:hypothetical protein